MTALYLGVTAWGHQESKYLALLLVLLYYHNVNIMIIKFYVIAIVVNKNALNTVDLTCQSVLNYLELQLLP